MKYFLTFTALVVITFLLYRYPLSNDSFLKDENHSSSDISLDVNNGSEIRDTNKGTPQDQLSDSDQLSTNTVNSCSVNSDLVVYTIDSQSVSNLNLHLKNAGRSLIEVNAFEKTITGLDTDLSDVYALMRNGDIIVNTSKNVHLEDFQTEVIFERRSLSGDTKQSYRIITKDETEYFVGQPKLSPDENFFAVLIRSHNIKSSTQTPKLYIIEIATGSIRSYDTPADKSVYKMSGDLMLIVNWIDSDHLSFDSAQGKDCAYYEDTLRFSLLEEKFLSGSSLTTELISPNNIFLATTTETASSLHFPDMCSASTPGRIGVVRNGEITWVYDKREDLVSIENIHWISDRYLFYTVNEYTPEAVSAGDGYKKKSSRDHLYDTQQMKISERQLDESIDSFFSKFGLYVSVYHFRKMPESRLYSLEGKDGAFTELPFYPSIVLESVGQSNYVEVRTEEICSSSSKELIVGENRKVENATTTVLYSTWLNSSDGVHNFPS